MKTTINRRGALTFMVLVLTMIISFISESKGVSAQEEPNFFLSDSQNEPTEAGGLSPEESRWLGLEAPASPSTKLSRQEIKTIIITIVVSVIIIIGFTLPFFLLALWLNRALHKRQPNVMGYKWGYYQGFCCLFIGVITCIGILFVMTNADAANDFANNRYNQRIFGAPEYANNIVNQRIFGATAVYTLLCGIFLLNRNRFAWVFFTVCSLNPLIWIINGVYIKHRWQEMGRGITPLDINDSFPSSQSSRGQPIKPSHLDNVNRFYAQAMAECSASNADRRDQNLWAKAFAMADGDEKRTQARYIEMRATSLGSKETKAHHV